MNGMRAMGAATWVVALCACGVEAPAGYTVVDSAGVEVVTSAAPRWAEGEGWRVGGVQLAVGGEAADLFDVAGVVRRRDGGLVVADGGTSRLLFFDADGRLQAEAGGEGDGPGEFRIIQSMGLAGADSVWVYDYAHRRAVFFDATGALDGTVRFQPPVTPAMAVAGRWPDGTWVVTQLWGDAGPGPLSAGMSRDEVVFARYGAGGGLMDTLATSPGREVLLQPEEGSGRMIMGTAPFTRGASYALLPDGLVLGDQVAYRLEVRGLDGAARRLMRWAGPSLEITEADVDAWKEEQIASAASVDRASVRAYLADVPVPDTRPAYGRILTDPHRAVWVGGYALPGQESRRWDVFDADGVWLGPVSMPAGFRPFQVGEDWVVGLARDELDVERIEIRALEGR